MTIVIPIAGFIKIIVLLLCRGCIIVASTIADIALVPVVSIAAADEELPEVIFLLQGRPQVLVIMLMLAAPDELLIDDNFAPISTLESGFGHACSRSLLLS